MHILDYLRAITSSLSDSTAAEVATTATTLLQATLPVDLLLHCLLL